MYVHTMLIKTPLLHQSLGPRIFLSLSLSLFLADPLEREGRLRNLGNISLFPSFTFSTSAPDHQVPVHLKTNSERIEFAQAINSVHFVNQLRM